MNNRPDDGRVIIPEKSRMISYILKCIVVVCACWGVWLSALESETEFMGGRRVFMFFTIQSNIAIAIVCAAGAVLISRKEGVKKVWFVIKFVLTISITLTGAVFCFVLAPVFGPAAWNLHNVLTHVIVPVAAILDFFVTGSYGRIKKSSVLYAVLPPLAYAVYAGIGYVLKWEFFAGFYYPYFFLNWGSPAGAFGFSSSLPYMGCVWWILLLLILLILVGLLYLKIADLILKHKSPEERGNCTIRTGWL